jgi:hypothetical protein
MVQMVLTRNVCRVTASTDYDEGMFRNCIDQVCLVFLLSKSIFGHDICMGVDWPDYGGKAVYFGGVHIICGWCLISLSQLCDYIAMSVNIQYGPVSIV